MGTVADAALDAGGEVVGVIPHSIAALEAPHAGLTELHYVDTMHERKALMASRSDAFMVLPGGSGTLEEAFETVSWTQLGLQDKPTGFLNVDGFYTPLMEQLELMVRTSFVQEEHGAAVLVSQATLPGMPEQPADYRLYGDLAEWWPLISPATEYAEDAAFAAGLFGLADGAVRDVLELGSGGGSNASHLTHRFAFTLVDLSDGMLAVSRQLNPDSLHVRGDMRTIRLGRSFDAVFVHDALDYMTSEDDLRQVMVTAFEHCRPGGVAVFMPDNVTETFEPASGCGGADGADGRAARFLDWSFDPDPADTWTQTDYAYMLRHPGEPVRVVQESHRLGLFPRDTWLSLLAGAGFEAQGLVEETSEFRRPRDVFTGVRPAGS